MPVQNFGQGFQTFDMGRTVRDVEAIKTSRLRNAILTDAETERKNVIAQREKAKKIRQQIEQTPAQIEAMESQGLFDEAANLRNSYINSMISGVNVIEAMRESIDASNYKQFRQDMIQSGAMSGSMLPVEYSDKWFREEAEKQKSTLQMHTRRWASEDRIMSQDIVSRDGEIFWEGQPYEDVSSRSERRDAAAGPDGGKPDASRTIGASDSNAIANASGELYGGFWDPVTQRYSGLSKDVAQNVAAVAEEAERIFRTERGKGNMIGHRQAVAKAARTMGIDVQNLSGKANDPLGLR